jgi:hypothetical protein
MTTYSEKVILAEEEKNEISCDCVDIDNYRPKNVFVFPGGGISATILTLGVYRALHNAGLLLDDNGELNRDNVFIGSSGGVIPGLLIANCINLKLTKQSNWFEKYVESPLLQTRPLQIIDMYATTQLRSLLSEKMANCFLDDWSYTHLDETANQFTPDEFKGKQGICFLTSYLADHFKFNYVKVVNGNQPFNADNHKDTSGMTVIEQFKTIFASCCTINGLSYARYFQNHDGGVLVTNYINCVSKYMENKYIRNLFYYTLVSYDDFSYNNLSYKNTLNSTERDGIEQNYFLIHSFENECLKRQKNFCLINPPNKFNPIRKFDVELYNQLQQRIYYTNDFGFIERFTCSPFFRNGSDFRRLVVLIGYYETLYIFKEINAFNKEKQKQFNCFDDGYIGKLSFTSSGVKPNVTYNVTQNSDGKLFKLSNISDINNAVNTIKYNEKLMIAECFKKDKYCGCRDKSATMLVEYLTMMQGYNPSEYTDDVNKKYNELFPIQTGKLTNKVDKKIWAKPEKYLSKDFKRVSKNIVNIYFPSFKEKLKNIIPMK